MKFKIIIWDWNGTLLNDVDYNVAVVNQMLTKQNKPLIDKNQYRSMFTFPITDFYKKLGLIYNDEKQYLQLINQYNELYRCNMFIPQLYPMAIDTLNIIKKSGIKQIILSGQNHNDLITQANNLDVRKNVDHIIGSLQNDASNKSEMLFDLIQKYRINLEDVLIISDTISDWEISCEINCHCVLLSHGHQDGKTLSSAKTRIFDSFGNDLLEYLL